MMGEGCQEKVLSFEQKPTPTRAASIRRDFFRSVVLGGRDMGVLKMLPRRLGEDTGEFFSSLPSCGGRRRGGRRL